jgi:hypothetical protein
VPAALSDEDAAALFRDQVASEASLTAYVK